MLRKSLFAVVAVAGLLAPASAFAQGRPSSIGKEGQFVLSAERLFGFNYSSDTTKEVGPNRQDKTDKSTSFSLLVPQGDNFHAIPRVALDYFVIPNLSIGGNIGFAHIGTSSKNGGIETDGPSTFVFVLSPRVGYAFELTDMISLWPRAGLTYFTTSTSFPNNNNDNDNKVKNNGFSVDLEAAFTFMTFGNFGFMVAPSVALPVGGSASTEKDADGTRVTTEVDKRIFNLGINAGLLGTF